MLWKYIFILFPAGILAGITGSVAGLASLVSYPALLAVGIPPIFANVTNTASLIFSAVGSGVSSKRELRGHGRELLTLLPLTIGGSICGSILLLVAPAASFEHVVPFFIFGAAVLILRPELRKVFAHKQSVDVYDEREKSAFLKWEVKALFCVAVFIIGAYTGYFGAAGGVVMLALLSATSHAKFAEYNALKNMALGASNLVATILFVFHAHIYWLAAAPLAVGFLVGGFIGPYIVRHVSARLLRILIAVGAVGLATVLFIQTYFG